MRPSLASSFILFALSLLGAGCAHSSKGPESLLVVEGAPAVPAAVLAAFEPYLDTRSATLAAISDDGKTLLIATRFGSVNQLHRVSAPLGMRQQVTFGAEGARGGAFLPGRDDAFVFSRDIGGNEKFQIFATDLAKGETNLLTDGTSRHGGFAFSRDGQTLAYTSNARNGRDMDVWTLQLADPAARRLRFEVSGHWSVLGFSPDGKHLLLHEYQSIERSAIFLGDLGTGKVTPLSKALPDASIRAAAFTGKGLEWLALTDYDADLVGLWRGTFVDGVPSWRRVPTDFGNNIEDLAVSEATGIAALSVSHHAMSKLFFFDIATDRITRGPPFPTAIISGLSFAKGAPILGLSHAGPVESGDVSTYSPAEAHDGALVTPWTKSEMGGLQAANLVTPQTFEYQSFDSRQIPAFIYRPAGKGPHPVVINIHGGPESQSRPWFHPLSQALARLMGVATIFPNVRGSDGYGKAYLALDNGRLREDSVKDIGALLDWVATQPDLDASRVSVLGGSYGGYMVLASLAHYSDRIVSGIDVVGISDFVTFLENTSDYRRHLRRAEYGDESDPAMRTFLKGISPLSQAKRIKSALFVAHGANDPRVPLTEAMQIAAAVRESGRPVWTMVAHDEGHGFSKRHNRDMFTYLTAMFLDKTLLDGKHFGGGVPLKTGPGRP